MVTHTDIAPYAAAWEDYRRRWRTIYILTGGTIIGNLLGWAWPRLDGVLIVVVVPTMFAALFLHWRLRFWTCPRCEQHFFYNPSEPGHFYTGGRGEELVAFLSWRCRHCRLPKWAVRDPE